MPSPNTITAFYTMTAGALIRSSYVNNNFNLFRGNLMPIDASLASFASATYDLGSESFQWQNSYHNVSQMVAQSTPSGNPGTTTAYKMYFKSDGNLYKLNSTGTETQLNSQSNVLTTKGDLISYNSITAVRIGVGTDGQVLTADASSAAGLKWATPTTGQAYRSVTASETATTSDRVLFFSGASFTEYLPTASTYGDILKLRHNGTSLTQIYTIDAAGSETIDGTTTITLNTNGEEYELVSNGANWEILSHKTETGWISYSLTGLNLGVLVSASAYWMRSGDGIFIRGAGTMGTVAASSPGGLILPGSLTINSSKIPPNREAYLGVIIGNINSTSTILPNNGRGPWALTYDASNTGYLVISNDVDTDGTLFALGAPNGIVSTGTKFTFMSNHIPISGWRH